MSNVMPDPGRVPDEPDFTDLPPDDPRTDDAPVPPDPSPEEPTDPGGGSIEPL